MISSLILGQGFLPLESVRLGRLILNLSDPQNDYFDPPIEHPLDIISRSHAQYSERYQQAAQNSFGSTLTRLLSASRTKRSKSASRVLTKEVKTYQLGNSGSVFREGIKVAETRKWVEEQIEQGADIYMIVGYHSILDAEVFEDVADMKARSAQLALPTDVAVAAATGGAMVTLPISKIVGDIGVANQQQAGERSRRHFVATGEQICAVQYRKLKMKWFSRKDLDGAVLKQENIWKLYLSNRGDEEADDVLEVDLDDLEPPGDLEVMQVPGEGFIYF
jgi:hypothetical protein